MSRLVSDARLQEVQEFMLLEAETLDDGRFRDWLGMMGPEVDYRMPVRSTRDNRSGAGFSTEAFHFQETRYRLEMRIARMESGAAWAEEPRSRTRHFVTNVRVREGAGADEVSVKSNLLLYRSRGDDRSNDLLSAERHDLLRRLEGQWKLVARTILLDSSTLPTHNLSVFL